MSRFSFIVTSFILESLLLQASDIHTELRWAPHSIVNSSCPIFILAKSGDQGLGDQLEHFIFSMNVAKLLGGTIIIDDTTNSFSYSWHKGGEEYRKIFSLLGIHSYPTLTNIFADHQPVTKRLMYASILGILSNNTLSSLCNSVIDTQVNFCGLGAYKFHIWCFFMRPDREWVEEVSWYLRNNTMQLSCKHHNLGFSHYHLHHHQDKHILNIVWHCRGGDETLHVTKEHYLNIFKLITLCSGLGYEDIGHRLNLVFETQTTQFDFLLEVFPKSILNWNHSLEETVCNILTSDIFVTSGSSIAAVAAFAPPFSPIIFEVNRKWDMSERGGTKSYRNRHAFNERQAVLLEGDQLAANQTYAEVVSMVRSVLQAKNKVFW